MTRPASLSDGDEADRSIAAARWRTWMTQTEALIFASPSPVTRAEIADLVDPDCVIEELIADIRAELHGRPYDIVAAAGGWAFRTRPAVAEVLRRASRARKPDLSSQELEVVAAIAYHQPVTRAGLNELFGREISRDLLASLRSDGLIDTGARSPTRGAPPTYVTTRRFLERFGLQALQDLPDPAFIAEGEG